ncbi:MAG TPA: FG-GAP-like repeat-containing protein [Blastocatellia bacterium]
MKSLFRGVISFSLVSGAVILATLPSLQHPARVTLQAFSAIASGRSADPGPEREEAYRANNIGVALLDEFKFQDAAAAFRRALKLDPALSLAHLNLCIALFNVPDLPGALAEAKIAAAQLPNMPQPHYMLGLIARTENRSDEATSEFKKVLAIDPDDVSTNINLGQLYLAAQKFNDAIVLFRRALENEPYNITAAYSLATALRRAGKNDEAKQMFERFTTLRSAGYGTALGQKYLEQGRYSEGVPSTGLEPEVVDTTTPNVKFDDVTTTVMPPGYTAANGQTNPAAHSALGRQINAASFDDSAKRELAGSLGCGVVLFDFDLDGALDMFVVTPTSQKLYRNDCGKYIDITAGSGLESVPAGSIGITAVAGDYDNDGKPDLFVLRYGRCSLYHNDGNGKFSDRTTAAGIPVYPYLAASAAFVDVDHDGDLDIFIAGLADLGKAPAGSSPTFPNDFAGAPNLLLRNDGNGKFTDITDRAKVGGKGGHAVAIVPTDFDNDRAIDLFVLNYGGPPVLFRNLRDGTFKDVAPDVGLNVTGNFNAVAAGDFNKDGYTDFFLSKADGAGLFAASDGKKHFATSPAPAGSEGAKAAQFLDYDDDGLLDLVTVQGQGPKVFRNIGSGWVDVTKDAVGGGLQSQTSSNMLAPLRSFASGDIGMKGSEDLLIPLSDGRVLVCGNDSGNHNHSFRVQLDGKVSNRSGVGTKIEMRSGSLWQKLETCSANPAPHPSDTIFGLGKRGGPDAIRAIWPSGVVQAEAEFPPPDHGKKCPGPPGITITELDRKPSSCPFLYTWNGSRFEFITDFMGGGEMGSWEGPGERDIPDPDEYVRIPGDQLKARDGHYEIRMTNELEEVMYVDRLQLVAVDHPADTEVYPNEGLKSPPRPAFKLYTTRAAHLPVSAVDDKGHDELPALSQMDRKYVVDFGLSRIRGFADTHSLTLDLGPTNGNRALLLMTGWTDYSFSSDNVAASQSGIQMITPYVQVKDSNGKWQTVIPDMGFPVGRPQTVVVDLTGKFRSASREVRIVTNMRIYWDQALVDTSSDAARVKITRLDPLTADLHWRGYSEEVSPDGREPNRYDYDKVSRVTTWKLMPGRYTREGDVRELLTKSDDMFVVSRTGDEISLSFDASRLGPPPAGWKRTFLLYVDGFSKEMDINSGSPDQVAPLPFHAMGGYPYSAPEAYPMTRAHREYIDRYNTRVITWSLPPIESLLPKWGPESGSGGEQPLGKGR